MSPLKNNHIDYDDSAGFLNNSKNYLLDYKKIKAKKKLGLPLTKAEEEVYAAVFAKETLFKKS